MPLQPPVINFDYTGTMFSHLMNNRIHQVLLIASSYDAFILEEDGRIDEKVFFEYVSLHLKHPPQFIIVNNLEDAETILKNDNIDLVINMLSVAQEDTLAFVSRIKAFLPDLPIAALAPFNREMSLRFDKNVPAPYDYVFAWLGNTDILVAIIKLIEDKMNADHDILEIGVQAIILVEDSIRYYSSYLPNFYKIIFKQSMEFMHEGLNDHQRMLRMRGRAKILLATTFEEATALYDKYKYNLHGIISDMTYKHHDILEKKAGANLAMLIKKEDEHMPFLLQSSEQKNVILAKQLEVGFIYKHSKTLAQELERFIINYFAFGDFIFVDPITHKEVERASSLKDLQKKIFSIPAASLRYHMERNHISKWLNSRALFPIATLFKEVRIDQFPTFNDVRSFVFNSIATFRIKRGRGVIAQFNRKNFDEYFSFTRIGSGSLGGKARGLAFLDSLIWRNKLGNKYEDVQIRIPQTLVLTTDVFDEFMDSNQLYEQALSDIPDKDILKLFLSAKLPKRIKEDLRAYVSVIRGPIAVRSSSLLEDSHYQPFAGIYSTYMLPLTADRDIKKKVKAIREAIKAVYASVFFRASKSYMQATSNVIDEEKMGIVIQEVVGVQYDHIFYPTFSGVARSVNFYPIYPEKSEEGIADIAMGLGKYIVDGSNALRFSPRHPRNILQHSTPDMTLRESQKFFFALDLSQGSFKAFTDDSQNLKKIFIDQVVDNGSLNQISSTYDLQNHMIRDGSMVQGKKIITFANILKYDRFPLPEILQDILDIAQREMNKAIEIEFAAVLDNKTGRPGTFYILQIRPIVEEVYHSMIDLSHIKAEDTLLYSTSALGNGSTKGIRDFIFVKPENFDPANNTEIANMIGEHNKKMEAEDIHYALVGPGRWGSSDHWLGIPVKWHDISMARLIVEAGLKNYRVDPSQGTHFFQNLTSFKVGYFTINPDIGDGHYDLDTINAQPCVYENEYIKHVRFEAPLQILTDGRSHSGVVMLNKKTDSSR